jgi:hypothetical protein
MDTMKVLFHVNEAERWGIALANITNLIKDVGQGNAEVVVLANGPSVSAYAYSDKVETMEMLAEKGVQFLACRNSLKKMCAEGTVCINEEALPAFVKVIPAGITELVRRQHEGYAYGKP